MFILEIFPLVTVISSAVISGATRSKPFIFFTIGAIISDLLNHLEKSGMKLVTQNRLFLRPNPPEHGCGYFPKLNSTTDSKNLKVQYGFPSGHAQFSGLSAVFWTLYLLRDTKKIPKRKKVVLISVIWLLAFSISFNRVCIGCHNLFQITTGFVIGIVYGFILYKIYSKFI